MRKVSGLYSRLAVLVLLMALLAACGSKTQRLPLPRSPPSSIPTVWPFSNAYSASLPGAPTPMANWGITIPPATAKHRRSGVRPQWNWCVNRYGRRSPRAGRIRSPSTKQRQCLCLGKQRIMGNWGITRHPPDATPVQVVRYSRYESAAVPCKNNRRFSGRKP